MKPITVVVLGNNRPDLEMMKAYISESLEKHEECQANVIGFIDPDKAYEYIVQNGCDILFSEAELCGTDGLNLLQKIRKEYPQTNIVITTTYEEYIVQAVQMQIRPAGYLSLPTTLSKMQTLIEGILTFPQTARTV